MHTKPKPTRPDLLKLWTLVYGAEGEGEGSGETGGEGQAPDPTNPPKPPGQESEGDDEEEEEDDDKTVPISELRKIRREAAKWRVEAQEAKEKLDEKNKAEMSEIERAKAEREEANQRAEKLEAELRQERFESALISEASSQKFNDPSDVIALISREDVKLDDDGKPVASSLKAAVERVAKAKPYLLSTSSPGSGDGGSRGSQPQTDRLKKHEEAIQSRGGIKIPT